MRDDYDPLHPERLSGLQVFYGEASGAVAHLYARLQRQHPDEKLEGTLRGPYSAYAYTLQVTTPLRALDVRASRSAKEPSLLAASTIVSQAIVPDPCFWTPEFPATYELEVALHQGTECVARARYRVGIRTLCVRGERLVWEGKPWVIRAARVESCSESELEPFRDAALAVEITHPSDELCAAASERGVLLIARLAGDASRLSLELTRLGRWPAVGVAVTEDGSAWPDDARACAPNLLLADGLTESGDIDANSPSQLAIWNTPSSSALLATEMPASRLPLVVRSTGARQADPQAARAACDAMQRALAGRGRFVGYIV